MMEESDGLQLRIDYFIINKMVERGENYQFGTVGQFQPLQVEDESHNSGQKQASCKSICLKIMSAIHIIMMLVSIALFILFVMVDKDQRLKPFKLVCIGPEQVRGNFCIIAIDRIAFGFIAIGQIGIGAITISQLGIGLFFCLGQIAVSLLCAIGQLVTAPLIPICQHGIAGIRLLRALVGVQLYPYFFKDEEALVRAKCRKRERSK